MDAAMTPVRVECLQEAALLTAGDREAAYGPPVENMQKIANIFNAITGHNISAADVATFHMATKLARSAYNPTHRDSTVDLMAYAGIRLECDLAIPDR